MPYQTRRAIAALTVATLALACVLLIDISPESAGAASETDECPCRRDDCCVCKFCGSDQCVLVPEIKTSKKWIYATKVVPYCLKTGCRKPCTCRHDDYESCPECESRVRYKRVLVKREVVTKTEGFKCVPMCEACRANLESTKPQATPATAPPVPPATAGSKSH